MKLFLKYLSLFLNYRKLLFLSVGSNVLAAIFTVFSIPLLIPFFSILFERDTTDQVVTSKSAFENYLNQFFSELIAGLERQTALLYICSFIVVVFLLKNMFRYLSMYFIIPARNGIVKDLRSKLFESYMQLPNAHFKETKKGDMISRMGIDIMEIEWSILNVIQTTFKSPIIIVGSIIFMLLISVKLTLFVILLILITILIIGGISRSLKQRSLEAQSSMASLISYIEESLASIKTIKALRSEKMRFDHFEAHNQNYKQVMDKVLRKRDLSSPLSEFLGIIIVCVLLVYGSTLVFNREMMPETFFAFIFAFYQVIEPSKSFASAYFNIRKGMASIERIDTYISRPTTPLQKPVASIPFTDRIVYENITFQYPDGDTPVVDNFNLTIKKGETIAILGPSGVGKTTIMDLLLRFYDPTVGSIYVDGNEIRTQSKGEIRSLFAYVEQDTMLFHDSVLANITMCAKNPDFTRVKNAAQLANAHEFIEELRDKYDHLIGESGSKLSGGQKQRIALARAIYQDAPIFLFDEATSALDQKSETLIQASLQSVLAQKTAIIIAHKLSTINMVDRVIILQDGRIIEDLANDQLAQRKDEIFKMQTLNSN